MAFALGWLDSNWTLGVVVTWSVVVTLARGALSFSPMMDAPSTRQSVMMRSSAYFAIAAGGFAAIATARCDTSAVPTAAVAACALAIVDATRYTALVAPQTRAVDHFAGASTALALCAHGVCASACRASAFAAFVAFAATQWAFASWYVLFVTTPARIASPSTTHEGGLASRLFALAALGCLPKIGLSAARIDPWPFTGIDWLETLVHAPPALYLLHESTRRTLTSLRDVAFARWLLLPALALTAIACFHSAVPFYARFTMRVTATAILANRVITQLRARLNADIRARAIVTAAAAATARATLMPTVVVRIARFAQPITPAHYATLALLIATTAYSALELIDTLLAPLIARARVAVWSRLENQLEFVPVSVAAAATLAFLAHATRAHDAIESPTRLYALWNDAGLKDWWAVNALPIATPYTPLAVALATLVYATVGVLNREGNVAVTLIAATPGVAALASVAAHLGAKTARASVAMSVALVGAQEVAIALLRAIARGVYAIDGADALSPVRGAHADLGDNIAQFIVAGGVNVVVRARARALAPNSNAILALYIALAQYGLEVSGGVRALRTIGAALVVQLANVVALITFAVLHTSDAGQVSTFFTVAQALAISPAMLSQNGVFAILLSIDRLRYFFESILFGARAQLRRRTIRPRFRFSASAAAAR